ncbi:MAG: hypothetical protein PHR22_05060, partial [Candidatus Omnitrophica bacterium]|nr:hypothetical protein [Candidatus Omnitrophota bacterium]
TLISFFNSANPEDEAVIVAPSPVTSSTATAAEAPVPAPEAPAAQPEKPAEIPQARPEEGPEVILDDFLPAGAVAQGIWDWDTAVKYSGEKSHTQPAAKGFTSHSYKAAPVDVPDGYILEQYVYLDPKEPPSGIMLTFRFEAEDREGEIGLYREGEEEVFVFNEDEPVIYDGTLPDPGKWEKWTIDPEDLDLNGTKITGISFAAYGGKVNWDLTRFVPSKNIKQNSVPPKGPNN